jgi:SAM-dependent methyltransferase
MYRFLRCANWLPRPLVKWLRDRYLGALDLNDRIQGRSDDLVPPRSLHFIGGGDFQKIGENFFHHFVDVCDLRPDETILDIGCGTGRMAIPLLEYIREPGAYIGFDISEKAIRWCQDHITSLNPRFTFVFADMWNKEYNPKGKISACDYRLPCEAASIDFAFATSVFTHMRLPDVRHYLSELHRSLKPSGRAMLTFFIMDETNQRLVRDGKASAHFSTKLENCYTIDRRTPERAIAYTEVAILNLFSDVGLCIKEPILWGSWSGRASMLNFQDVVIATKMGSENGE